MSKEIVTLSESEIEILKELQAPLHFKNDFDLVYESQVPSVGIVFLQGEIKLLKKRKVLDSPPIGTVIGIHQLVNNTPLPVGVKICRNSTVLMLEKSSILEALNQKTGRLYQILSNLF